MEKILVLGANGQIGVELTLRLRQLYGKNNVIATDIKETPHNDIANGPFATFDAADGIAIRKIVEKEGINQIYLLAALLSATGEKDPGKCWHVNMESLRQVLEIAVAAKVNKVFWPSSIAVFGSTTPKINTLQQTVIEPKTMYGITKYAGELLCQYYFDKYGLDVRSIRYPGLISWKCAPTQGTTDYAVEIYHAAIKKSLYTCFLSEETYLPMMYIDDAIRGTIELMQTPIENVKCHMGYNLSAMTFSPKEIANSIRKYVPEFQILYKPDHRQLIANNWPQSIDDTEARTDWNWRPQYDLDKMTIDMLMHLKEKITKDYYEPADVPIS